MADKRWYAVYTSGLGARSVTQIQSMVDRLGFNCMLWSPSKKETINRYGKDQLSNRTLFPSYLFINCDELKDSKLEQALIENKLGRFLKLPHDDHHDLPTPISEADIEHLKSLEEADVEPVPEEITVVEVGNLVEVCVGPFMGIKGIVTGVHGHEVSIETLVFGRSAPVRINSAHLSKLTENNPSETIKE